MHAHHEHQIGLAKERHDRADGRLGVQREAGASSAGADPRQRAARVGDRLDVHREVRRAGLHVAIDPVVRPCDPGVHVGGPRRDAVEIGDHLGPECEIRPEMTVHHVDVYPVGPSLLAGLDGLGQTAEIRRKDGRSQLHAGIMRRARPEEKHPVYRPQNLRIPGPTFVPQTVLAASARPMINHRGPEFAALLAALTRALQDFLRTEHDVLLLSASGSGGLEAAIANTLSSADKALVFSCGAFGERFAAICKSYGVDARRVDVPYGRAVEPDLVRDELAKEKGKDAAKAVLITHNETSTGVLNPIKDIAAVVRDSGKLFLVDSV